MAPSAAARRRVRHLTAALRPSAAAGAGPTSWDELGASSAPPGPRFQLDEGGLPPAEELRLREELSAAVAAGAFREAASLQDALRALGTEGGTDLVFASFTPSPTPPQPNSHRGQGRALEFMRGASLDQQADFFFEHGFAALPNAVEPSLLAEMQAAWTRKQAVMEPLWRERVASGSSSNPRGRPGRFESRVSPRAFDMPAADFFSGPDGRTLLDVIALPDVVALLERVVAPRPRLRCCGVQARTVIPQSEAETAGGYTNWRAPPACPMPALAPGSCNARLAFARL